jgi:hypothetical protein
MRVVCLTCGVSAAAVCFGQLGRPVVVVKVPLQVVSERDLEVRRLVACVAPHCCHMPSARNVRALRRLWAIGSEQATQKLCILLMDQALERMVAAGGDCETVLCIFDLRGFGYATPRVRFRAGPSLCFTLHGLW